MSLKDEIDKIIRSEREKLESRDQKHKEHWKRQGERFRAMRALLEEVVSAVDQRHVKASFSDSDATIEIGNKRADGDYFEVDVRWKVQPNFSVKLIPQPGEGVLEVESGFRIEESITCRQPEFDYSEKTLTFDTESEAVQYIIKKMADNIALYQHIQSFLNDRKNK